MPFLSEKKKRNCQSYQQKSNRFRTVYPHIIKKSYPYNYPRFLPVKRVSRFTSVCRSLSGSMTVEASLAVPLFLFFMVNIISLILLFHTFASNLEELHQQGRQLAMLAYVEKGTGFGEGDMIRLVKPERVRAPVPILSWPAATVTACCYMRAWTGYDVQRGTDTGETEIYVYVAEHGTVYHRSENCSHLTLSIELVSREEAEERRNSAGARYHPCERCGGDGSGAVYITGEGNRYHNTISCSGLKRSVRRIPLSDVGGMPPCGRCGRTGEIGS